MNKYQRNIWNTLKEYDSRQAFGYTGVLFEPVDLGYVAVIIVNSADNQDMLFTDNQYIAGISSCLFFYGQITGDVIDNYVWNLYVRDSNNLSHDYYWANISAERLLDCSCENNETLSCITPWNIKDEDIATWLTPTGRIESNMPVIT